jgi:hypothetical protein
LKILKPIFSTLCLAALAFFTWYFFFPPPEKAIRKQLAKLSTALSANPQGNIAKVSNVNTIVSFLHPEITINLERFGREVESIQGRHEVQQMAFGARQSALGLSVKFENINVKLEDSETNATVYATAVVRIGDQTEPIVQDIKIGMEKVDRQWLVRSATPGKTFNVH